MPAKYLSQRLVNPMKDAMELCRCEHKRNRHLYGYETGCLDCGCPRFRRTS